jgi:hypothetical protein
MPTIRIVPTGAHGFDADTVLTAKNCRDAKAVGFSFAIRYVGRDDTAGAGNLTPAETQTILAAGLGLMAVQHVATAGWSPSAVLGRSYGKAAAAHAAIAGLIPGANLWVDLEGIDRAAAAEDVIAYCNAWAGEAMSGGFVPGIYVGANAILSGAQLYWRLQLRHYWQSGSIVPDIPHRGYQMKQRIVNDDKPFGVEIDRNVAMNDSFGEGALMMA